MNAYAVWAAYIAGVVSVISAVTAALMSFEGRKRDEATARGLKALDEATQLRLKEADEAVQGRLGAAERMHQLQLETTRAELRRQVDHEVGRVQSRLHVASEIEVRLHERSWHALSRLLDATHAFDGALRGLASARREGTADVEAITHVWAIYGAARMAVELVPPQHGTSARALKQLLATAWAAAYGGQTPTTPEGRSVYVAAVRGALDRSVSATEDVVREWGAELWRSHERLLTQAHMLEAATDQPALPEARSAVLLESPSTLRRTPDAVATITIDSHE